MNYLMVSAMLLVWCSFVWGNPPATSGHPSNEKTVKMEDRPQTRDVVVAEVNGGKIFKSQFEQTFAQNQLFVSDKIVTKEKVINDLINRELGIQRAKKNKLFDDPTVKAKMEDILYHAQISKDLEPAFRRITVTTPEIKEYVKNFPEYRTAHILFRMRALPDPEESDAALTKALEVYKTLTKDPTKFPELANKYSQASVAPNGGDLGFRPAVQLAPEYFQNINGKEIGHITGPVRTQFGYHIIKILAVKEYKDIDEAMYKKIIFDQKRDNLIDDYFADMRKSANIKIDQKQL